MTTRRLVGSIGLMIGATLLSAGCSSDDSTSSESPTAPDTTVATLASSLAPGDGYVALGTSIASGYGISVQSTSCGRSDRNYPQLVAARYELMLTDVSCGGAVTANIVDTPQGESPPQIEAVGPDTELITVTVGGNDIGYNGTAVGCGDPSGVCTAPVDLDARVARLRPDLLAMIDELRQAAPDATLVFVTYPREVPPSGNCAALSFTDEEVEIVRSMGEQLQAAFLDVAEQTDVVLVDPYSVEADHTGCAPESERWVSGKDAPDSFSYHPTALGHVAMAEMISEALGQP
ncbi:MAG TPA: SGNH/GDSL hydrolase family protein [Acidimicrobiales bacterium]